MAVTEEELKRRFVFSSWSEFDVKQSFDLSHCFFSEGKLDYGVLFL